MSKIFVLFLLVLTTGCLKTMEQIKQEKDGTSSSASVSSIDPNQQKLADLNVTVQELEAKINALNGRIEELEIAQKTSITNPTNPVATTDIKKVDTVEHPEKVVIASDIKEKKAETDREKLLLAQEYFEKKEFNNAQYYYEQIIDSKDLSLVEKNYIHHDLGIIHYNNAQYENSLILLSKVYTKWPNSSKAPNALLYIARCFHKLKRKTDAKDAYNEFLKLYPKSSLRTVVQEELSQL